MEAAMSQNRLPTSDSIKELAAFWDSHDVTDFDNDLVEVAEPVFVKKPAPSKGRTVVAQAARARALARSRQHTSRAGVLAVAAELSRRSYDVIIPIGKTPKTDLVATASDDSTFKVEVKSASTPNFVLIQKAALEAKPESGLLFVVVLVPRKAEDPFRFFIMTQADVQAAWKATRKTTKSGAPYKPGWEGLNWNSITPHENCWHKLPGAQNRPAA
jgi:hypothetical protein